MIMTYILTVLFALPISLMLWLLLMALLYDFFTETSLGKKLWK